MSDNRMNYSIDKGQFPLVQVQLEQGEHVFIQRGSMVYHSTGIQLNTHLNGKGSGFGKLIGAIGRSMTSGESMFITEAISNSDNGLLALAPNMPGEIIALELGANQYRLNDGAFLAMDGSANYTMERQSLGRAVFSGTGGLFVMTTGGEGVLLCNTFGSVKRLDLNGSEVTIDNNHVVAWSRDLDYDIHMENGFFQSIGTGEGIVNTFRGTGSVYIQSLNVESFAGVLSRYIATSD
ncbi:MAG: TIGR00266 family protein [Eubacteriales bacterium]|nr:TIGR00266 family protein [Eubacteriales bacterium]